MKCEHNERQSSDNRQGARSARGRQARSRYSPGESWRSWRFGGGLLFGAMALLGCASPPSVLPLIRIADRALAEESQNLDADGRRIAAWLDQQRQSLADALEADVRAQAGLDAEWVMTGTQAYAAAREALLRHELSLELQRQRRRQNLQAASAALQRAAGLIEQQDRLLEPIPDLRRWLVAPEAAHVSKGNP
jgi:hypothetical protein